MEKRRKPSAATVISLLALAVAMTGSAYAFSIPRGSVKTRHLARGAVTTKKLADDAVTSRKVKDGTLLKKDMKAGEVPTYAGTWSGTMTYAKGSVVQHNGSSWIADTAIAPGGPQPGADPGWTVFASKGEPGEDSVDYWVIFNGNGDKLAGPAGITTSKQSGQAGWYNVTFPTNVQSCATLATYGEYVTSPTTTTGLGPGLTVHPSNSGNVSRIRTYSGTTPADFFGAMHVAVFC